MLIELIDKALIEAATKPREPSPLRLSNSGICARRLAYELHRITHDDPPNPRRSRTFEFGHATETLARQWVRMAGISVEGEQREVTLDCGGGLCVSGHIDGEFTLNGERWLLEVKSINTDGFQHLVAGVPDYSHVGQANGYMEASGVHRELILYVDKNDQELLEKPLQRDPAIVEQVRSRFRRVAASTPDALPGREHEAVSETEFKRGKAPAGTPLVSIRKTGWYKPTGRKVLGFPCTYCPWKGPCWGVKEPEFVGGKPTWVLLETALGEFMK